MPSDAALWSDGDLRRDLVVARRNNNPNEASKPPAELRELRVFRVLEGDLPLFRVVARPGGLPRRADPVLRLVFVYWRAFFFAPMLGLFDLAVSVICLAL
jgi:hypothetical protein